MSQSLKSAEFSPTSCRKGSQRFEAWEGLTALLLPKDGGGHTGEESRCLSEPIIAPSGQPAGSGRLFSTTVRNGILPTSSEAGAPPRPPGLSD